MIQIPLDFGGQYTLTVTHQHPKWHPHRHHDSSKTNHKDQKAGNAQFLEIPTRSSKELEYPSHSLACEITHPYKNWHSIPWCLLPSEMAHILSMECISPGINLISLSYGLYLKSFLYGASNPHLVAISGTQKWSVTWPSSSTPLSFLQQIPLAAELDETESCDVQPTERCGTMALCLLLLWLRMPPATLYHSLSRNWQFAS